ncbi:Cysteine proteinase inhibitor 12 [Hibiscus syriacus]|uniref:Cysteine proteinase inhibitor n=1 Tax=Hibiscus syriacus TaxID=106335 RepID=A0A6A3CUL4_HIBSY|nr:Cysteine proteinase inhibitor 12 [Hibiscus syriacus]
MVTNTTLDRVCPSQGSHNYVEIENPTRFFVDEHNKKKNTMVEFVRVVKASKQVVAGTLHHLKVEAINPERCPYIRSNSLLPYELIEFVHANVEVSEDFAKLNMPLKLKRGDKEDKNKEMKVNKNNGRKRRTSDSSERKEASALPIQTERKEASTLSI